MSRAAKEGPIIHSGEPMSEGFRCSVCGLAIRGGLSFCPNCGHIPVAECPECGYSVQYMYMLQYRHCPGCGAPRDLAAHGG